MKSSRNGIQHGINTQNPESAHQNHKPKCDYYSLFEQATDAILVTDFYGNLIDVNSSMCAMLGYTKEELLGKNVIALIDPTDLKEKPIRFDLLAQGKNTFTERKAVHKDGTIIYLESNAKECGKGQILVIARNITERKKTESILQESEANLQTILNNTDTIYVLLDKHLRIISYNARARAFAEQELEHNIRISDYFLDYFSVKKRPVLLRHLMAALQGKHINYEISYPQAGNTPNWYNVKLFPISNGGNEVYGVMMAVSDISETVILEQKLEEERIKKQTEITDAVITAEERERHAIGQELHDNINQLLLTARLYLGTAKKQSTNHQNEQLVNEAYTIIDKAITDIRNLSHSLISPFIDEYGLLQALDYLTEAVSKSSGLNIDSKIEVNESALGDKLKLAIYRIVQEQLTNVIKYAKATAVTITLKQDMNDVALSVKDNGVGFDTLKTPKGTGFVNMRTRASLFEGKLDIDSSPGNGCTVRLRLKNNPNSKRDSRVR